MFARFETGAAPLESTPSVKAEKSEVGSVQRAPSYPRLPPKRRRGATVVEYAVMLALIVTVALGSIATLGGSGSGVFDAASKSFGVGKGAAPPKKKGKGKGKGKGNGKGRKGGQGNGKRK